MEFFLKIGLFVSVGFILVVVLSVVSIIGEAERHITLHTNFCESRGWRIYNREDCYEVVSDGIIVHEIVWLDNVPYLKQQGVK